MRRSLLVSALLGTLIAGPVGAQRIVSPGDTVQVALLSGGRSLRGVLQAAAVDRITLRLGDGADRIIPTSDVRSMDMLDGRKQARGRWARGGFVIGMLAGATMTILESSGGSGLSVQRASLGAILGGLGGAAFGLVTSWSFEDNHWIPVRTPGPDTERVPTRNPPADLVVRPGAESSVLIGVRIRR